MSHSELWIDAIAGVVVVPFRNGWWEWFSQGAWDPGEAGRWLQGQIKTNWYLPSTAHRRLNASYEALFQ